MQQGNFVIIPNMFLSDCNDKLTPEELSVYYFIKQHELKWFYNQSRVSIKQIAETVRLQKNVHSNMNRIKAVLNSLREKNIIMYEDQDPDNSKPLQLKFEGQNYFLEASRPVRGYEMIPFSVFQKARNSNELYASCLILKSKNGQIAYSTFATLLEVTDKTAKTLISGMVEAGMIQRFSGDYYQHVDGGVRQEINKYVVNDHEKIDHASDASGSYQDELKERRERRSKSTASIHEVKQEDTDWGNWNKKTPSGKWANLNTKDMYLYLTQMDYDEEFKVYCEDKMERLKKKGFKFDKMLGEAKQQIYKKKNAATEYEKVKATLKESIALKKHIEEKKKEERVRRKEEEKNRFNIAEFWDESEELAQ